MGLFPAKLARILLVALALGSGLLTASHPALAQSTIEWATAGTDGKTQIHLYFFWSENCPHCTRARPYVERLAASLPWLTLHSHELSSSKDNARRYVEMATAIGQQASSVPAFLFCGNMLVGYEDDATTGELLRRNLIACHDAVSSGVRARFQQVFPQRPAPLRLPLVGDIDVNAMSLPVLTVVLAGLDSFNPCAFFVLLFLLSLLVHARSRARMFAVGGVFVFFSGLVYFLFMAAWLNLFLVVGQLDLVTAAAGAVAVVLAALNIKDFFWFRRGVTLGIPDGAKPGLFQRMRGVVSAGSIPAMLLAAVMLALAANAYELLCTAGFPMVFTRVLTLHALPQPSYYLYLALYNLIYVVPLLIIVIVFAMTLGGRKLQEREGRILKLLSGLMMLGLGVLLLVAPVLLNNVLTALVLLAVAVAATLVITRLAPPSR